MKSRNHSAALKYLERGWSVIPMNPQTKKPMVRWKEFQTRKPTAEEINSWWGRYPNADVGVVTGRVSGIVVVDVDHKAMHLRDALPSTGLVSQTGSGGYHYFYQYPHGTDRVKNVVRKDGFDVRADGGYVVLPPSTHKSGRQYAWVKNRLQREGLEDVPDFVLRDSTDGGGTSVTDDSNWLSKIMLGVGAGQRNDAAARLAGYYFGKGMPLDVVMQNIQIWNERNDPPLSYSEISTTVRSVYDASRRPRTTNAPLQMKEQVEDPFALLPLSEYMTKFGSEEVTWTVDGWMPDRTIALLVAPPGTYKTWLELDLAISVASGLPFLGQFEVKRKGPVIIVQQEDFHGQMAERIGAIAMAKAGLVLGDNNGKFEMTMPPELPIYLHPDRRLKFNDSVVLETLRDKIAKIRPVLVIIDPLYSTGETDDYFAKTVSHMFALKSMRDEFGCSFALAHHTSKAKKGEKGDTDREGAWGSQFINAFLETGWQIRQRDIKSEVTVRRHFKASPNADEVTLDIDISTVVPYSYKIEVKKIAAPSSKDAGSDYISLFEDGKSLSMEEVVNRVGKSRSTVSRRLAKMIDDELLKKGPDGRFSLANDIMQGTL